MTKKDEMSFAERDEAIIHMLGSGKNLWFISDKIGVPESVIIDVQRKWKKGEISLPKQKEPAVIQKTENRTELDERDELILKHRKEGLSFNAIAEIVGVPSHVVNNVVQREKKKKKPVKEPVSNKVMPLKENDISVTSILVEKAPKQVVVKPVKDKTENTSTDEIKSLRAQINDLNRQLDGLRENEKNTRQELINQKSIYEKQLTADRREKEKVYADYSAEVENGKRLRKQVEDLLMVDGLNVGLMQQNLMFRERFGMQQNGEKL